LNAEQRGWGDPDAPGYRQKNIITIAAGGIRLAVHKKVAPIFEAFITELVFGKGYDLDDVADDWGYANRDIRGRPGVKSNHSWGLAIDLNATNNPMSWRLITTLPPDIRVLAAKYRLTWGGSYANRKDPMHFEFEGTPYEADVVVHHIQTGQIVEALEDIMSKLDDDQFRQITSLLAAIRDNTQRIDNRLSNIEQGKVPVRTKPYE
jgi:hypothetical protein